MKTLIGGLGALASVVLTAGIITAAGFVIDRPFTEAAWAQFGDAIGFILGFGWLR